MYFYCCNALKLIYEYISPGTFKQAKLKTSSCETLASLEDLNKLRTWSSAYVSEIFGSTNVLLTAQVQQDFLNHKYQWYASISAQKRNAIGCSQRKLIHELLIMIDSIKFSKVQFGSTKSYHYSWCHIEFIVVIPFLKK